MSPSPLSNTGLLNNSSQKLSNVTSLRNNTQSLGNETQSERSYNGNTTTSTTFHVKSQEVKTEVNKVISTTEASEELLSDNDLEDEDATCKLFSFLLFVVVVAVVVVVLIFVWLIA